MLFILFFTCLFSVLLMIILSVLLFVTDIVHQIQVSCVTDHVASQDTTAKSADLDDDEGGLVSSR